jgi:hypothetical protein
MARKRIHTYAAYRRHLLRIVLISCISSLLDLRFLTESPD